MGFLDKIFRAKEKKIGSYADFWEWFSANQAAFRKVVMTNDPEAVEKALFDRLSEKLGEIKDGFFFLVGMVDDSTADLVLTADGVAKNVVFVEELVAAAPEIDGWQFTPLKPPSEFAGFEVRMNGITYSKDTLSFYPTDHADMPDLVDITIVHKALDDPDDRSVRNGAYLFLDNNLGELSMLADIDQIEFAGPADAAKDLIPIEALENYLQTRKALFIEKYDGVRIFTESDTYSLVEVELRDGQMMIGTINSDLVRWDSKASHPWMLTVTIAYDATKGNGMPDVPTQQELNEIEEGIRAELRDVDGYLNIGRQTARGERDIFFACVDFRKPSKVVYAAQQRYRGALAIKYEIYKDKYWQTVRHLIPSETNR